MKFKLIVPFLLVLMVQIQANPHRWHYHPDWRSSYYDRWNTYRYNPYYQYYQPTSYYTSPVLTTKTITTYPTNLVMITVETVASDVVDFNNLMTRGLISEKDFIRAKRTLLNRIGMSYNPDAGELKPAEIINQIETLHDMHLGRLLTKKEFLKQKKKLLAML